MKRLFVFVVAVLAMAVGPSVQPHKAAAETLVCAYWPANSLDMYKAGYYWTLSPQGEFEGPACTPR